MGTSLNIWENLFRRFVRQALNHIYDVSVENGFGVGGGASIVSFADSIKWAY